MKVPLKQLTGIVTGIRTAIFDEYLIDRDKMLVLKSESGSDYTESSAVWPLLSPISKKDGGTPEKKACGAFHYIYREGPENNPAYAGTATAYFALLPRMPMSPCQMELGGIKPLVSISAGAYISGTGRFPSTCLLCNGGEDGWFYHRAFLPLAMDIMNRFAKQVASLPLDADRREDISHRFIEVTQ